MPRAARAVLVGYPLHVVQRGISRQSCFFSDSDYVAYLRYLGVFSTRFGCSVHSYCLMTNHVHLLLTPHTRDACALLMKHLGQCYVQRVNKVLGRTGTLWEGRFHSCLVRSDDYVLACYRYIELNPVRARITDRPEAYPWSSYAVNVNAQRCGFVTSHPAYEALGLDSEQRARAYKELCSGALPTLVIDEIRKATKIGCVVGAPRRSKGRPWHTQMRKMGSVPI